MISVYLLLDLFPVPVPVPVPVTGPDSAPDSCPAPPPVRPPCPPSPSVSLPPPSTATETGGSVARACVVVLLGDGIGRKCRPGVRRGPVGRRKRVEVFPGRAVMHRWATDNGINVPRACGAAPLGDGNGRRCRPGVRRGTVGRRIVAEVFPERAARHPWAADSGRSVSRACGAAPLGDGMGQKCSPGVRRGTIGRRNGAEVSPKRVARSLCVSS